MTERALGEYISARYPEGLTDFDRLTNALADERAARGAAEHEVLKLRSLLAGAGADMLRAIQHEREDCACVAEALGDCRVALAIRSRGQQ
jgi:hypothetical protein